MKTTTQMVDEEYERIHMQEKGYLEAERFVEEQQLMQELFEHEMAEKYAKIVLRKARKANKFASYATVKRPRILKHIQFKSRGL